MARAPLRTPTFCAVLKRAAPTTSRTRATKTQRRQSIATKIALAYRYVVQGRLTVALRCPTVPRLGTWGVAFGEEWNKRGTSHATKRGFRSTGTAIPETRTVRKCGAGGRALVSSRRRPDQLSDSVGA